VADVSVRPARAEDVPEIARIQVETWQTAYAALLPAEVLARATVDRAVAAWTAAVRTPPSPRHRVLVAQEQRWVVGFAAFGPAELESAAPPAGAAPGGAVDAPGAGQTGGGIAAAGTAPAGDVAAGNDAGEIHVLLVEPRWGRRGHGSRLLAATVDQLRAGGATRALVWVAEGDVASGRFYASAGWEPDGYVRTLADGGGVLRESRLHVALPEPDDDDPIGGVREGDER